VRDEGES